MSCWTSARRLLTGVSERFPTLRYKAADGTPIPAYLTLAARARPARACRQLCFRMAARARATNGASIGLPQFLAARGYAVIQPEYRGSAGYRRRVAERERLQELADVDRRHQRCRALPGFSAGHRRSQRMAIVGWSYGGYAALQAAATEPSCTRRSWPIAPVTDLALLKHEAQDYYQFARSSKSSSDPDRTLSRARRCSHAAAITAPVLLVHGDVDTNVEYRALARRWPRRSKAAGKRGRIHALQGARSPARRQQCSARTCLTTDRCSCSTGRSVTSRTKGRLGMTGRPFVRIAEAQLSASRTRSRGSAPSAPDRAPRRASARG